MGKNQRTSFMILAAALSLPCAHAAEYAGLTGPVGAGPNAKRVQTLRITEPGVYENIIVDGDWIQQDLVRILADNVVLRNCEIRYGQRDGIEVYARNVRIENCHIHHLLNQTFVNQKDSHGITGRPLNLVVRNTEISHVSGDAIQFDPDRKKDPYPWDNVLVENCFLWTGPLDRDYAGFHKGERPGENAFDSKVNREAPRATITIRNTLMKGWGHGQIGNGAALNLKEQIHAIIEKCVLVENDIAFRCRGTLGSAWVTAKDNVIYQTSRVFRLEHEVKNVKISGLALGEGIGQVFDNAPGPGEGFEDKDRHKAPPLAKWPYTRLALSDGSAAAPRRVQVFGHRGARAVLSENTIPAFQYAIKAGVDAIELDIAATRDNVLVISHDQTLNSSICTSPGGSKVIRELTVAEVRKWDCGSLKNPLFPKQKPVAAARIPTLDEVFDLAGMGNFTFTLDVKSFPNRPQNTPPLDEFARLIVAAIEHHNLQSRVLVMSTDLKLLQEVHRVNPWLRLVPIATKAPDELLPTTHEVAGPIVALNQDQITRERVQTAHKAGIEVLSWTTNEEAGWARLIEADVDAIGSDDPAALIAYLKKRKLR